MKKVLYFVATALLFIACSKSVNEPSYRDGKDISVSGKTYIAVRDTLMFNQDGTIVRHSPLFGGVSTGTYIQTYEVIKYRFTKFEHTEIDQYAISYGDFIYFEDKYFELLKDL